MTSTRPFWVLEMSTDRSIGAGKTTSVVGSFPKHGEAIRGYFRVPGGGWSGQVSRGRVPEEESTGVVCEDSPGEEFPGKNLPR